jgi:hypothetical protein
VGIEDYRQPFSFSLLVLGHESVMSQGLSVGVGTSTVTYSKQFFHAKMLLLRQFKLEYLWLIREVVLINMLIVEGAGVDFEELVTR